MPQVLDSPGILLASALAGLALLGNLLAWRSAAPQSLLRAVKALRVEVQNNCDAVTALEARSVGFKSEVLAALDSIEAADERIERNRKKIVQAANKLSRRQPGELDPEPAQLAEVPPIGSPDRMDYLRDLAARVR